MTPAGWPPDLPPPGTEAFDRKVAGWLFDRCPARYRDHDVLRRHPRVLAWLAVRHVGDQARTVTEAVAAVRAELTTALPAGVVDDVLAVLDHEAALLLADRRAVELVRAALSGTRFVERL